MIDGNDEHHNLVLPYFADLLVPSTVLPEFDYLATKLLGTAVVREFYRGLARGEVTYLEVELGDLERTFEIMDVYRDTPVGLVDASLVALAERYGLRRVLTLDRRHFAMFRPKGLESLELLP